MNELYLAGGILLLLIGIVDFVWTTLWIEGGAGPVTGRLSKWLWKSMRKLSQDRSHVLSMAGPLLLSLTLLAWICLFWCGWALVFASDPFSLTDTRDQVPASWAEHFYFAGYVFFTLGNGEIAPNSGVWQIVTVIATATGMLSITLAVTYLLSVLSAVTDKRAFAQSVTGTGQNGAEVVQSAWNGQDFHNIDLLLASYSSSLSKVTAQHKAYPILHYYHSTDINRSGVIAVAVLEQALTLLQFGVAEAAQPNRILLKNARASVQSYLETVQTAHMKAAKNAPLFPDLSELRKQGLPVKAEALFEKELERLEDRHKLLLGIVKASGRNWPL